MLPREVRENWEVLGELAEGSCGTGRVGRLSGRGDPERDGVAKSGGAGLELCNGKQISKVAWRRWLKEWMKCPVDQSENDSAWLGELSAPAISSLWHKLRLHSKYSQPLCWKGCGGTAKSRLKTSLKRRR